MRRNWRSLGVCDLQLSEDEVFRANPPALVLGQRAVQISRGEMPLPRPRGVDASSTEGTTADYNMMSLQATKEPSPLTGPHDLFGKMPVFMNPANMLFRLKAGSPGVGAGLDLSQQGGFSTDKDGIQRPAGKGWDMGPYQGQ
jgi:hypothetical protein